MSSISNAIDQGARARATAIDVIFKNLRPLGSQNLPQRVAILAEPDWSIAGSALPKTQIISAEEAGNLYGFGSNIHLIAKQLFPANGRGVGSIPVTVFPVTELVGGGAPPEPESSPGTITASGTQTSDGVVKVISDGIETLQIPIPSGTTVSGAAVLLQDAINANPNMPITANANGDDCEFFTKSSAMATNRNTTVVEIVTSGGFTFGVVATNIGNFNADVTTPLGNMGEDWDTIVITSEAIEDQANSTVLDQITAFNETRWSPLVSKPFVCFMGSNASAIPTSGAGTDLDSNKSNRTLAQCSIPGSNFGSYIIAGAWATQVAILANSDPAHDYGSLELPGIVGGPAADQWNYSERDTALKRGSGTSIVKSGNVLIQDTVTLFHPDGETDPSYRYVCDIMKVMNIIYAVAQEFGQPKWDGAPLLPDDQPTTNRAAKKPRDAKGAIAAIIDAAALRAILSDPATAKASIIAGINSTNPKRLDMSFTVQLSGNTNIISIDYNFGFYFGTP